ncbi:restriction endonuclease subunit S [Providencia manganoxydans]|uniref:restriction endonuclease subunit S n=1 Tax=Providencia manganoxydans TaxID=2923283 RepID=UPI0034E3BA0B
MSADNKVPEIRFKGFSREWQENYLGNLIEIRSAARVHKEQWTEVGVPFFRTSDVVSIYKGQENNKAYISHAVYQELSEKIGKVTKGDLFITGGGSIGIPYLVPNDEPLYFKDADLLWLKNNKKFDGYFLYSFFFSEAFKKYIKSITHIGTIAHYTIEQAKVTPINICEIKEQIAISNYLKKINNLINQHQQKHDKLSNIKKAMLEKMFPKQGETEPEIRFKGFSGEWERKQLDELCSLITKQTGFDYSATIKPSLVRKKNRKTYSFIQNKDFNGPNINLETDFFIPCNIADKFPRILIDTPSILISISGKIGNVGFYQLSEKSLVGGAVGICKLRCASDGLVIVHQLLSSIGQMHFQALTKSSSHANITVEDIRLITVNLPSTIEEKNKIGKYFNQLDTLINQHQQQITKLNNIKQACLSKMFV